MPVSVTKPSLRKTLCINSESLVIPAACISLCLSSPDIVDLEVDELESEFLLELELSCAFRLELSLLFGLPRPGRARMPAAESTIAITTKRIKPRQPATPHP